MHHQDYQQTSSTTTHLDTQHKIKSARTTLAEQKCQYIQHDAGCFRSCFVVPLSARLSFPQDQTINISCCRSESGGLVFVFFSLLSLVFTLYGRETPATTCYPSVMKHVFFRSVAGYPSVIEYMLILFRALAYLAGGRVEACLLYTSPSPRDGLLSRMPSSA